MTWQLLADLLVVLHLAFATFVIFGGFLAWKWRRAIFFPLPAFVGGLWGEISGQLSPPTPLEIHLRNLAGEAGYRGDFLDHYVLALLYPSWLTRPTQWVLAAVLLGINVVAYGALLRPHRHLRRTVP